MIRGYSDHAANERTFLAWLRTAIAIIAFGFVVEKFNLFLLTIVAAAQLEAPRRQVLERVAGPIGRNEGLALIFVGTVLIIVAAARFIRTGRLIDDEQTHTAGGVRAELILAGLLAFLVAGYTVYLALS
jgi:putative membrane protein